MIEFSKDVDKQAAAARSKARAEKEIKRSNNIKSPLHYDFANNENQQTAYSGSSMLGDKITEEAKVAKPAPIESKYDKSKKLGNFEDSKADNGSEMTKDLMKIAVA